MKNTLTRLICTLLALTLCLTAFAACAAAEEAAVDLTAYPEDFNAWTMADMVAYLKDAGVIGDFFFLDMSAGDLEAIGATSGYVYVDMEAGTVADTGMYFAPDDEAAQTMIASILENQAVIIDGDVENAVEMEAVVGNFAFSYGMDTDDAHIAAFAAALTALQDYYQVEAAYVITF